MLKKAFLILSVTVVSLFAGPKFVNGVVNHYNEFDSIENPNEHYWCGHAALKSVAYYKTGEYKTLGQIHQVFMTNGGNYRNNLNCQGTQWSNHDYCASLWDLHQAAITPTVINGTSYGSSDGYDRDNSKIVKIYKSNMNKAYDDFFRQIKGGINANYPAIVPSDWRYGGGHFWIVVGYDEKAVSALSYIYLRDVAEEYPIYYKYDVKVRVKDFVDKINNNPIQLLYVK